MERFKNGENAVFTLRGKNQFEQCFPFIQNCEKAQIVMSLKQKTKNRNIFWGNFDEQF